MEPTINTPNNDQVQAHSSPTEQHSSDLVCIFDMILVVCTNCRDKYYANFFQAPYKGEGKCQSLHPDSSLTDLSVFTLWAEFYSLSGKPARIECYYCFDDPDFEFSRFHPPSSPRPHKCERIVRYPQDNHFGAMRRDFFNSDFQINKATKDTKLSTFISYNTYQQYTSSYGYHLFAERICCTLSTTTLKVLGKNYVQEDVENNFLYLKSYANIYYISNQVGEDFVLLINYNYRNLLMEAGRRRLENIVSPEIKGKLDQVIGDTITELPYGRDYINLLFLLNPDGLLVTATKLITRMIKHAQDEEELWDEKYIRNTIQVILIRVMDISKKEDQIREKAKAEGKEKPSLMNPELKIQFQSALLNLIKYNYKFYSMLIEISEIQKLIEEVEGNKVDIRYDIPDVTDITSASIRLQFLMKAATFGEISVEEVLKGVDIELERIKTAINVTFDIKNAKNHGNADLKNDKFSPANKTFVLLETPLVHTLVMLYNFNLGFYYDMYWYGYSEFSEAYFKVFFDLLSIFCELSKDNFEISVLILKNFTEVINLNNDLLSDKGQQFRSIVFNRIFRRSGNSIRLKKLLIDMNLDKSERLPVTIEQVKEVNQEDEDSFEEYHGAGNNVDNSSTGFHPKIKVKEIEEPSLFQMYVENFIRTLSEQGNKEGNMSLNEALDLETNKQISINIKYQSHIRACLSSGLSYSFDSNYLTKEINDPQLEILELFSKKALLALRDDLSLSKEAKLNILGYYLNSCGEIGLVAFSNNVLRRIFKYSVIPGKREKDLPINMNYILKGKRNELHFAYQMNITKNIDLLLESFFKLTAEAVEEEEDLAKCLEIFKNMAIIARRFKFQLDNQIFTENIKKAYLLVLNKVLSSSKVKFEKSETSVTIENLIRFKKENDSLTFELTVAKPDEMFLEEFFENVVMLSCFNTIKIQETSFNQGIMTVLSDLDTVGFKKCVSTLLSQIRGFTYDSIPTTLDILLNLLESRTEWRDLFFEEARQHLSKIMSFFFYTVVEYLSTFTYKEFDYLNQTYFNTITKVIKIFRVLTDYNNMANRKAISNFKFTMHFTIDLGEDIKIFEKKVELNLFDISNILINGVVEELDTRSNNDDFIVSFDADPIIDLLGDLMELNSEILEGNTGENIEKYLYDAKNVFDILRNSKGEAIKRFLDRAQNFYLKLHSEMNIGESDKALISGYLRPGVLEYSIRDLLKFDPKVNSCIEKGSSEEERVKNLEKYYYTDKEKKLFKSDYLKAAFDAFVYLEHRLNTENTEDQSHQYSPKGDVLQCLFAFFRKISLSVELNVEGQSKEIFFLSNPDHKSLREDRKDVFLDQVDRSDETKKKEEIMDYANHFKKDMAFIRDKKLNVGWKKLVMDCPFKFLIFILLLMSVANIIIILNMIDISSGELSDNGRNAFYPIVIVQLAVAAVLLFLWMAVEFVVAYNFELIRYKVLKKIEVATWTNKLRCIGVVLLGTTESIALIMMVLTSIITLSHDTLYWVVSFQLIYFSNFSDNLMNVISAVRMRAKQLALVSLYTLFLLTIYGLATFAYIRDRFETEDGDKLCTTPLHCLASQLDFGLRMGGGMGDNMPVIEWGETSYWWKFFYSITHYIIFPIVMLNIVSGIIIDTFADLREQTSELENDRKNICLVCGKDRNQINREEGSYNKHLSQKHNVFTYMFFIMDISAMDEEKTDFYQAFVKQKLEEEDSSWMPTSEEQGNEQLEKAQTRLISKLKESEEKIERSVSRMNIRKSKALNKKMEKAISRVIRRDESSDEECSLDERELLKMEKHFTAVKLKSWGFN